MGSRSGQGRAAALGTGAAALLLAGLGSGCSILGAKLHNLDQLHASSGRHNRSGDLVGDVTWVMRHGVGGLFQGLGAEALDRPSRRIESPLEECLENLNELSGFDSGDSRTAAYQVIWFSRLAVEDPWRLSRERCVIELGNAGRRLRLADRPLQPPPAEPAGPEPVRAALQPVFESAAPLLRLGRGSRADVQRFEQALAGLDRLELDLQGGLRVLEAVTLLRGRKRALPGTLELSEKLQRLCVSEALLRALRDLPPEGEAGRSGWESPPVRAAAVMASTRAFGGQALAGLVDQVTRETEPQVQAAVLRAVRVYGLPTPQGLAPTEVERLHLRWTESIVGLAVGRLDPRVRVAAMGALGQISGREPYSLREEVWQAWWEERLASLSTPAGEAGEGNGSGGDPEPGPSASTSRAAPATAQRPPDSSAAGRNP
jgi:hypothetical protein